MLSESTKERIKERNRIYEICENSDEIKPGDTFKGLVTIEDITHVMTPMPKEVLICCGKISEDEMLFRTDDGRWYFSLRDGWGTLDGKLYGLRIGMRYTFKHPTTPETIIDECEAARGTYHSWAGAMAWHARQRVLDAIIAVMKRESETSSAS